MSEMSISVNEPRRPAVSIVMPAFNEGEAIGTVVARVKAVAPDFEVIVVDDGSTDDTAARAAAAGARVIRHPYNLGNGSAVKRGALAALGDVVVFMDADGQHPPEEIPSLVAQLDEFDMAVGARTRNSKTSKLRNVGNWGLIAVAQWITGKTIPDLTSGFRAMRRDSLLHFVHLFPSRYSYPTTITMAMLLSGMFVTWVPMDSIVRRTQGSSNIKPFRDFLRFVAIMFRMLMLFSPRRLFLPVSGLLFLLGLAGSAYQLIYTGGIHAAGVILLLSSLFVACFGLIADQVAMLRREQGGQGH